MFTRGSRRRRSGRAVSETRGSDGGRGKQTQERKQGIERRCSTEDLGIPIPEIPRPEGCWKHVDEGMWKSGGPGSLITFPHTFISMQGTWCTPLLGELWEGIQRAKILGPEVLD